MKKLSEILIKSQGKRKQNFSRLVTRDDDGKIQDYCAIGAVGCELGFISNDKPTLTTSSIIGKIFEKLGITYRSDFATNCPYCAYTDHYIGWMITHLNDNHNLTFEQIGNWLKEQGL